MSKIIRTEKLPIMPDSPTRLPGIPYIDIHSHPQKTDAPIAFQVRNISYPEPVPEHDGKCIFSLGLHPWHTLRVAWHTDEFIRIAQRPEVIAIGEAGLDRMRGAAMDIQTGCFMDQVRIAGELNKPLIIHCVRAWEEIIAIKIKSKPSIPWVIHGFRGRPELASQLVRHGFHLSFGEALLDQGRQAAESFRITPASRLFLETDDSDMSIVEIYAEAAAIRQISIDELKVAISTNFTSIFGNYGASRVVATD